MSNNQNPNKLNVPGTRQTLDQMKYEIAQEFGVQLGAEASSRMNGKFKKDHRNTHFFYGLFSIKFIEKNCFLL